MTIVACSGLKNPQPRSILHLTIKSDWDLKLKLSKTIPLSFCDAFRHFTAVNNYLLASDSKLAATVSIEISCLSSEYMDTELVDWTWEFTHDLTICAVGFSTGIGKS